MSAGSSAGQVQVPGKKRKKQSGASKRKAKKERSANRAKQQSVAEAAKAAAAEDGSAQDELALEEPFDATNTSDGEVTAEQSSVAGSVAGDAAASPAAKEPVASSTPVSTYGGSVLATAKLLKEAAAQRQQAQSPANNLASNADFISFSMDASDSDNAASPEDESSKSDDDQSNVFSKVAEKLGAFVKGSKDLANNKRKRQAMAEEQQGTPQSKAARKKARKLMEEDPYPWLQGKDYTREQEPARILHREIQDFVRFVEPTEAEHKLRALLVARIRRVVAKKWPTASVHAFGSFETRLYLPTSDIDLVLLSSGQPGDTIYDQPKHLKKLAHLLVKAGIAQDIQVITSARVPIIKFVDKLTQIHVDISFNKPTGLVAAGVVKRYCKQMPALRPLVIFIKHFLNMRGMNEVYLGGLGSYAITCLVISFLQRHPKTASGQIKSEDNLGVLAVEFLELYGKRFNYDVVGININGPGRYFSKQAVGWQRPGQTYLLSIQDPTDAENDIAKSSFGILKVKGTLAGGHDFLVQRLYDVNDRIKDRRRASNGTRNTAAGAESILTAVVSIDQEMKDSRHHLADCFEKTDVQAMLQEMEMQDDALSNNEVLESGGARFRPKSESRDPVYVAVEDEDDSMDDLIDSDGYKFTKPAGYKEPSAPGDVDALYKRLNEPAQRAPTAAKDKSTGGVSQTYVIESSDEEQVSKPANATEVIDLDSAEDSKVALVSKAARAKFWQDKGKVLADEPQSDGKEL